MVNKSDYMWNAGVTQEFNDKVSAVIMHSHRPKLFQDWAAVIKISAGAILLGTLTSPNPGFAAVDTLRFRALNGGR